MAKITVSAAIAAVVCFFCLVVLADVLLTQGKPAGYASSEHFYEDAFRLFYIAAFARSLVLSQMRGAYRLDRWTDLPLKLLLNGIILVLLPGVFFLVALPSVQNLGSNVTFGKLALTAYWISPTYGVHQTWLLVARPLGWVQTKEVLEGKAAFWWLMCGTGVVGPIVSVLLYRQ